ncbi:MAG: CRISPR-associated protein Cas5 [Candidatus Anstonellales archaeon]
MEEVIRISAFQPRANYRMPLTVTHRITYTFLPISTAIGFIANLIGYNQWNTSEERREKFLEILRYSKIGIITSYEIVEIDKNYWFRNPAKQSSREEDKRSNHQEIDSIRKPNKKGEYEYDFPMIDPLPVYNLRNVMNIIYVGGKLKDELKQIMDDRGIFKEHRYIGPLNIGRAEDLITAIEFKFIKLDRLDSKFSNEPIILNDPMRRENYSFIKYLKISPRHTVMLVDTKELKYEDALVKKNVQSIPAVFKISQDDGSRTNVYINSLILVDYIPTNSEAKTIIEYKNLFYDSEYSNPVYLYNLNVI